MLTTALFNHLDACLFWERISLVQANLKLTMYPGLALKSWSSCLRFRVLRLQACATSPSISFLCIKNFHSLNRHSEPTGSNSGPLTLPFLCNFSCLRYFIEGNQIFAVSSVAISVSVAMSRALPATACFQTPFLFIGQSSQTFHFIQMYLKYCFSKQ